MIPGETIQSQKALGIPVDHHMSDFKVLKSANGWFIGTMYLACGEANCTECSEYRFDGSIPTKGYELDHGSRETDYFETEEKAKLALETYQKTGELPNERY